MLVYAFVLFGVSGLFLVLGIMIFRGNTDLIHSYHRKKVRDKAAYGKAFGVVMLAMGAVFGLSGIAGLFDQWTAAMVILVTGLTGGLAGICLIQRKYNGGLF